MILSQITCLALASFASASERTASIYIQAVTASPGTPVPLAELQFDTLAPSAAQVVTYDAPELPDETKLVRIGVYDPSAKQWASSTSVASIDNFEKGYAPTLILSVEQSGEPISAAVRGVRIDAGQTRDFGPQAMVLVTAAGKQPDLNKPVILSPEGKQVVPEEKTMLQKYVEPYHAWEKGTFFSYMCFLLHATADITHFLYLSSTAQLDLPANFLQILVGDSDRCLNECCRRR